MQSEESRSKLIELPSRRSPNGIKRWTVILGLIGAAGLAGSYVAPWINWPWADKARVERIEVEQIEQRGVLIRLEETLKRIEKDTPAAVADEIEKRRRQR